MSQIPSSCASTSSSQATSATSKGRGQNKLLHVYARTEPGPVDVDNGIPCGKKFTKSSAKTFWSWCTICLRRHHRYSLDLAHDWRNIPDSFKENLWNEITQKWIMEPVNREYFYSHAGKLWKDIKHHYRLNYFNNLPEGVDPLQNCPHNIPEGPQWSFLVKHWQGERWKENALKHKTARVANSHSHHRMGSTGYPALSHSLTKEACEKGESPHDRFDIWLVGVKDKKGNVDDEARRIIEIFEAKCVEFTSSNSAAEGGSEGSTTTTPTPRERAWDYIVNEHKKCADHGYIRGMGSSITFPLLSGGKSKRSRSNVEMQFAAKLKELEEKLDSTQEALRKQEEIVIQQQQALSQQQQTLSQQQQALSQQHESARLQQETANQQAAMLQELMGMLSQQRQGGSSNQSSDNSG